MQIGVEAQRAVESKRVFVVETDEVSAMALQFILADEYETHVLADLAAALDKGRAWPPDLVLLGAAAGVHAVGQLLARWPALKIVVVADAPDDAGVVAARAAGAHSVLLRPFTLEGVRRKVDTQIGRLAPLDIAVVTK